MPERIVAFLDLAITGVISTYLLIFSFGIIPMIVAVLNGIYIVSRIKRDADKYNDGNFWNYLKSIFKKKLK